MDDLRTTAFHGVGCTILQGASHRDFVYDSEDNHMGLINSSSAAPTSGLQHESMTAGPGTLLPDSSANIGYPQSS